MFSKKKIVVLALLLMVLPILASCGGESTATPVPAATSTTAPAAAATNTTAAAAPTDTTAPAAPTATTAAAGATATVSGTTTTSQTASATDTLYSAKDCSYGGSKGAGGRRGVLNISGFPGVYEYFWEWDLLPKQKLVLVHICCDQICIPPVDPQALCVDAVEGMGWGIG